MTKAPVNSYEFANHLPLRDVETALDMPFYHPVIEEGLRTAWRDLCAKLGRQPEPPPRNIDCGPGA